MRSAHVARRKHAKKVGNVHCLVHSVQVTRIYIAVEETLLGFVLASKRVPRCKEEGVLYKRIMDRFCAKLYNLTVRSVQTTQVTVNTLEILCFIAFIAKQ